MYMAKKRLYAVGIPLVLILLIMINLLKKDIWDVNAEQLVRSFDVISGDAEIQDMNEFIPFAWDSLYSFDPYSSTESIYEVIGYRWDLIYETVDEAMNQMVFMKDGKVVCYLYGYPDFNGVGFNFGAYEGNYIKLTPEHSLHFTTTINENGFRYFQYVQ